MNYKSLLLLPAALLSGVAMADTVTPEQALGKARSFFQQSVRTRGQQAAQALTLAHTAQADGETHFYVFNNPGGGYVIVGGDDVAQDVLAYSESGSFAFDQLSPATRWWLGQYQNQIHSAIVAERQGAPAQSTGTRASDWAEVKPLLGGIEWDQMVPYNAYIQGSGQIQDIFQQYCTGCVATATAQVMRYWKYPERGMFGHSYPWKGQQLEANFAGSAYQWDLMQEKYELAYSGTPEENAVAQLMSDLGIALNMDYGRAYTIGSETPGFAVPYALRTYFGYSKEVEFLNRDQLGDLPSGEWEKMVYSELAAGRPVIYGGADPNGGGGHCFVCDGYKNGYFHINWGWGGKSNDEYFLLTSTKTQAALNPKEEGAGSNDRGQYSGRQAIIVGIQPDPQSEGFVYLSEPMSIPAEAPCSPLHFEGKLYNPTSQDVKVLVGLQMQDSQNIFVQESDEFYVESFVVIPAKQEITFSFDVPEEKLIPGVTYKDYFTILDASNPEIPEEAYSAMQSWLLCYGTTHIEGPEHVLLTMFDGFASLCAPFDAQIPEGVEAYTADRISGDQVIMKQAKSIEAGRSYLLVSKPMEQPILLSGMKTVGDGWSNEPVFKGNLTSHQLYLETACYFMSVLQNGDPALVKTDQFKAIAAHKVIIDGSMSDAEILYLNFDEATGIQQVDDCSNGSGLSYNLMGQPQHEAKGLVVEDGRVTFVK